MAFSSEQNAVRYLPAHRMLLAVRIGQLTAEVFHLLDLQPCWLLLRFETLAFLRRPSHVWRGLNAGPYTPPPFWFAFSLAS